VTPSRLVKRVEGLEVTGKPQDPGAIVCEPEELEALKAKYPHAIFIIDDIPKTIEEVQNHVVIYKPGTDPEQLKKKKMKEIRNLKEQ